MHGPRGGGNFNRRVTEVRHLTPEITSKNLFIFAKMIPQNLQATENIYSKLWKKSKSLTKYMKFHQNQRPLPQIYDYVRFYQKRYQNINFLLQKKDPKNGTSPYHPKCIYGSYPRPIGRGMHNQNIIWSQTDWQIDCLLD